MSSPFVFEVDPRWTLVPNPGAPSGASQSPAEYGSARPGSAIASGFRSGGAEFPADYRGIEVPGVAVDAQDRVYVFSRGGSHPVIVFDRDGKFLHSWGQGLFARPHGISIAPDGSVCVPTTSTTPCASSLRRAGCC